MFRWLLLYIPLWFVGITVSWVTLLKWAPVYYTPLMAVRSWEFRDDSTFRTHKRWMPMEKISPNLAKSVVASEDSRFYTHKGFDWVEIKNAVDAHQKGKKLRGASTISQQTAKNVFLLPGRSWVRKGLEAYFTCLIEWIWGKERILEVYLNVAPPNSPANRLPSSPPASPTPLSAKPTNPPPTSSNAPQTSSDICKKGLQRKCRP